LAAKYAVYSIKLNQPAHRNQGILPGTLFSCILVGAYFRCILLGTC